MGAVIEYNAGFISPNAIAQMGTRGRNDEPWEQRAISKGRSFGLKVLSNEAFQKGVLRRRQEFRTGIRPTNVSGF